MFSMQIANSLMEVMVSGCSGPSTCRRNSNAWRCSGSASECLLRAGKGEKGEIAGVQGVCVTV